MNAAIIINDAVRDTGNGQVSPALNRMNRSVLIHIVLRTSTAISEATEQSEPIKVMYAASSCNARNYDATVKPVVRDTGIT
jgi:hypothetical protein